MLCRITAWTLVVALPCGAQEPESLAMRVDAALDRATEALRHHLRRSEGSELALVSLASAHAGLTMADRTFADAARRLVHARIEDTYGLSLRLMLAAHVPDLPEREDTVHQDSRRLLSCQSADGGFGYRANPGTSDLSNTQYAALGLRAAAFLGESIPEYTWRRLGDAVRNHQADSGGFGYTLRGEPTSSMTVAGIAVLEICRRHLQLDQRDGRDYQRAIDTGWRWVTRRRASLFALDQWHALYAFYGVERAAVLSGLAEIADSDWFEAGAEVLLDLQEIRGGGFANTHGLPPGRRAPLFGTPIDTAFAVLFLRRSFQPDLGAPTTGPITPGPSHGCRELAADADESRIRAAIAYDQARGRTAVPDLLVTMRIGHSTARRAAALALLRISGEDFGYHPARNAEQNAAALRRAERWWLTERER